jgi:hypothetical protein
MVVKVSLLSGAVASDGVLSIQSNGTTEAISISTGQVATFVNNPILTSGTANGVAYLNGSKVLTTGSALVFDGTNLGVGLAAPAGSGAYRSINAGAAMLYGNTGSAVTSLTMNGDINDKYIINGAASALVQSGGAFTFYNAASNNAGDSIAYTQLAKIDSAGNLGLGVTPSAKLQVAGVQTITGGSAASSANGLHLWFNTGTNTAYIQGFQSGVDWRNIVYNANSHIWQNTDVEHMRLDASGNLLVGTTGGLSGGGKVQVLGVALASAMNVQVGTNGYPAINFLNTSGTQQGYIQTNASTVLYVSVSDYRLKENVQPMIGALEKVAQLKPCTYTWKENGVDGQGFIAHELQAVVPDAVSGEKDSVETYTDAEGNEQTRPKYQGIDTSFLVATLTAAIQELDAKFESYKAAHP